MTDALKYELISLRNHMDKNHLFPKEPLEADNQSHEYTVTINRETRQAVYSATAYPLEDDLNGPTLIAWYGFQDEEIVHQYSSLKNKK